ncbi:cell division protein FtsA [Treponema pedis]|uniref:cell division protein FtsA n=1 Tax=Treponema pedis TaxID=409322 RepID=UPI0004139943|nr:cell division protein FtsA [Treponema pedis]QSI05268.1 cell division protein FtsA [Treponema pedis]
MSSDIIVGLDIGTKNTRVVVAEKLETGGFQIIGIGSAESTGMRKGSITNIESTVRGINNAVESAEMMSGVDIDHCVVGLGGTHIEGLNSRGVFPVSYKGGGDKGKNNREIDKNDIESVINSAKAVVIPLDREIIHVVPQSYTVDKQRDIKDPLNMIGVRLEAEVHIITGSVTSIKNMVLCVNRANLRVDGFMHHGLADVKSVMTRDEQELGSILIDIGAGTTEIVVMQNGAPVMTTAIPVGGIQVTNDLAVIKKIPFDIAEKIKLSNGCCWSDFIEANEQVLLPGVAGRGPEEISKLEICEIFQARMAEIFAIIKDKVSSFTKGMHLSGSVVICGGGALLSGTVELASEIFNMPSVRLGVPATVGGLTGEYRSPEFAAVLGLVWNAYENQNKEESVSANGGETSKTVFKKFSDFFKDLF